MGRDETLGRFSLAVGVWECACHGHRHQPVMPDCVVQMANGREWTRHQMFGLASTWHDKSSRQTHTHTSRFQKAHQVPKCCAKHGQLTSMKRHVDGLCLSVVCVCVRFGALVGRTTQPFINIIGYYLIICELSKTTVDPNMQCILCRRWTLARAHTR